jgi:predicted membrane protein (TIGR00267 family)
MPSIQNNILKSLREIVFGLEDGMVSTLGVITGIASATNDRNIVIVSGFVVIAVESLSMAAGTYLSNKSEMNAESVVKVKNKFHNKPIIDAIYMGISYIFGGIIAVSSYWFFPISIAVVVSIIAVVVALFVTGMYSGKLTKTNPVKTGLEMVFVSLSAAFVGFSIGKIASIFFPDVGIH